MISPQIARELRGRGKDVHAVKRDRPELESLPDAEIVRRAGHERRAIVTDNVKDFQPIHQRTLAAGDAHYGMLFTSDATMPRSTATIPLWVSTLDGFLGAHPREDALRNRMHFL